MRWLRLCFFFFLTRCENGHLRIWEALATLNNRTFPIWVRLKWIVFDFIDFIKTRKYEVMRESVRMICSKKHFPLKRTYTWFIFSYNPSLFFKSRHLLKLFNHFAGDLFFFSTWHWQHFSLKVVKHVLKRGYYAFSRYIFPLHGILQWLCYLWLICKCCEWKTTFMKFALASWPFWTPWLWTLPQTRPLQHAVHDIVTTPPLHGVLTTFAALFWRKNTYFF